MRAIAIVLVASFVACAVSSTAPSAQSASPATGDAGTLACNGPPSSCPGGKFYRCVTNADVTRCSYQTSDGHGFSCASCTDCSSALMLAAQWCSQASSSSSSSSSGSNETCGPMAPCGSGGSFQMCNGADNSCRYHTSDGTSFACTTCDDCASASIAVAQWCKGP